VSDRLLGCQWHGLLMQRVCASAAFLLVAVVGFGCGGAASGTAGNPVGAVEPTPWTEGTLRARVGATIDAAARTPESVPAVTTPARAVNAPGPSARPTAVPALATFVAPRAAAPPPAPGARVEAVDFNAYRIESGWTFIQGFARNTGPEPAGDINLFVILLGDGDAVTGSAHAHIKPVLLEPGEQAPWLAQVQGAPDVRRVRVQVTAQPLTDALRAAATRDFRLDEVAVRPPADPYGPPTIVGTVVNAGATPATEVEVTAAIFDADGALYQVARTAAQAPEIPPGQGAPFEIRPLGRGLKEIPRYELFVVGRPKQ
jgi:hypothetical protein